MSLWSRARDRVAALIAGDLIAEGIDLATRAAVAQVTAQADARVREALSAGLTAHPGDAKLLAEGYRSISASRELLRRDLQPMAQDEQNRRAYYLWESNLVAHWLSEVTIDFTLGEGAMVTSEVPAIQAAITAFWGDGVNQIERRLDTWAREYRLYGELCLPVAVNEINGHVRLGYVDPLEIAEVLTDPNNALIRTGVVLKGAAAGRSRVLKIIGEDLNPLSDTFGYLMPAVGMEHVRGVLRNGELLDVRPDGACFLFQTNRVSNARRGRSDHIAALDWLDALDGYMFDALDAAGQLNQFIWDVKLTGMSEEQIRDWQAKQPQPRRGERRAHNEKVEWSAVAPDLKAQDKDSIAKLFRGHVIGAYSFPEHFFGSSDGASYASAKEMGLPPVKNLSRKQKELRFLIQDLVTFALHQKIIRGVLAPEYLVGQRVDDAGNSAGVLKRTDQAFTVALPELSMRDQSAIVAACAGLVVALTQAKDQGWLRPETACRLFASLVSQLGFEVKADEEFTPGAGPAGAGLEDYTPERFQQTIARTLAQLGRLGKGDGDNVLQPKMAANGARA